jgi:PAS domain S-box-containing protein
LPADDDFQKLADGAPVMIWMSGHDMGCYYFNRAWLEFRGRTLEQEAGNGWAEGVHPEHLDRCVKHYVSCFERRLSFAMSYRLLAHTGQYRWILDRGAPHVLPDGTFLGYFGGCVEIDVDAPVLRHAELGTSLAQMKAFAQRMAVQANEHLTRDASGISLEQFAHGIHVRNEQRAAAAGELEQLATDMLTYSRIPRGACVP